jgi:hypothetical protein
VPGASLVSCRGLPSGVASPAAVPGVESARLTGIVLELRLTAEAADALGVAGEILLQFEDEAAAKVARNGLRRAGIAATST